MRCVTVYTNEFEKFSDIFEQVLISDIPENEDTEVEGVTVGSVSDIPEEYIEQMRVKPEVVVMRDKKRGITILQHGKIFEIFIPSV
ncbi:NAD/NADP transhydrogenase alpha subunit [Saccharibacillus sp. CPCC 101409]|uniref:NAD/NADP transhydrogenase alpha subunit n=1 Tax=Saccharibacillus sp. CPCC 101409 TaxID=3058041 RepID=UPI002672EFB4|nr:NAD/NADP transhydrogenase alpha subunit [Saccharibacillus sp. CPCC 101409]MDO3409670.1 NAD/NADP transhydrogenase alpha subunit [Saccharibacillus sp. CPCC 101409]